MRDIKRTMKTKKIVLSGIAALSCAALCGLSACTAASAASLVPNWYGNTTLTTAISGTYEELTYAVTYEKGSNENYAVQYEPGVYTVVLENTTYNEESVYRLTSELQISGVYTMGGETLAFTDSVESVCYFRNVSRALYPLYSLKTVHSTSPRTDDPDSLGEAVAQYNYTVEVTYSPDDNTAHSVYTDLGTNEKTEYDHRLRDNLTVLDNETLLFAARGMTLSVGSAESVYVLNPYNHTQETVAVSLTAQTADAEYEFIDKDAGESEATKHKLTVNTFAIGRSATLTGKVITARYAAPVVGNNTYRSVMLEMENPLSYNMGTLVYTLAEADFTDK